MKFKRWAAGIAALLLILSMGLISCAKPAGGTPEDNPVPQEEEDGVHITTVFFQYPSLLIYAKSYSYSILSIHY